jgi:hypothetical protein
LSLSFGSWTKVMSCAGWRLRLGWYQFTVNWSACENVRILCSCI